PSLREHICITLDRLSVNKYWGTGSKKIIPIIPHLHCAVFQYDAGFFRESRRAVRDYRIFGNHCVVTLQRKTNDSP
ncbi:MAG: hypothetical protein K2L21_01370, partial [Muribaculaceae bacterium]|nr:hypothetical protein [Muribaculaceae bacterium]